MLVVDGVTLFKFEGVDVFALHFFKGTVVKVTIVTIEEEYMIFDRRGAAYVVEFRHGLKPPISVHVAILCVMECPFKWDVVMEIL